MVQRRREGLDSHPGQLQKTNDDTPLLSNFIFGFQTIVVERNLEYITKIW